MGGGGFDGWASLGGILALAAIAVTLVALIALHVLPTGLSPLRDPVSRYGITRFRAGYAVAAVSAAVAGVGGILALVGLLGEAAIPTAVLLCVFSLSRLVIPAVPMDDPHGRRTGRGRLHNVLAFLAFGSVTAAAFVAAGPLHDTEWIATSIWSTVLGVVMALGAIGMLVAGTSRRRENLFGSSERLIYLGFIAWFVLIGAVAIGA